VKKICKSKEGLINRKQFNDFLSAVGLGGDKGLSDKLFFVFDANQSGFIDYREMILGIEMFRDTTFK